MKQTTKTKQRQLSINLNQIMNPNPKLVQTYKDANMKTFELGDGEGNYHKNEYTGEKRVFFASKASGTPIKHKIFSVYRKQVGNTSYVYFFDLMTTQDFYKNKVDFTRFCGRWEKPEIITRRAVNAHASQMDGAMVEPTDFPSEIDGFETVYEYPFDQVKEQLKKWWEDGTIPQTANFYAVMNNGSNKYGGFSFDEFINLDMSDLELLGKFGNRVKGVFATGDHDEKLTALRTMLKEEMRQGTLTKTA